MKRTEDDYYKESKRLRAEVLVQAETLKYFAYFDRELGVQTVLAMRKMKNGGPYKPYAIIDAYTFSATKELLQKGTPL